MKSTRGEDRPTAIPFLPSCSNIALFVFDLNGTISIIVTNSALQNNNLIYKWMVSNSDQTNPIKKNWAKEQSK